MNKTIISNQWQEIDIPQRCDWQIFQTRVGNISHPASLTNSLSNLNIWLCCTCSASGCHPVSRNTSRCISTALVSPPYHILSRLHISSHHNGALSFSHSLGCNIQHRTAVPAALLHHYTPSNLHIPSSHIDPFSFSQFFCCSICHHILVARTQGMCCK